nr:unnamed protein product [Callosobruchus analis]
MSRKNKPPDIDKKCEMCEEDIRKGSAKVNCKNPDCDIILHQKCFLAAAKAIKMDSCDWICKNCCDDTSTSTVIHNDGDVVKELEVMKNEVRQLSQMVNELTASNKLLLEKIAHSASPTTSDTVKEVPLTYSQAVKKEGVKKSTSVLIIRSKDEKESNFDVMKNIKGKINPATDKIGVNYTKLIKNGMLVNCTDDDSLQKLKGAVASKFERKYEILTPKPLRPRLIIPDVDKSVQSKEEFIQHIEQGNPILSASDIKVVSMLKLKFSVSFIIEVDPDVRKHILSRGYLFVAWQKCTIRDYVSVTRCFNCCRYGHVRKDCKEKPVCSRCSGEHSFRECNSNTKKCINCAKFNSFINKKTGSKNYNTVCTDHAASDTKCPCFIKRCEQLKSRIDYG